MLAAALKDKGIAVNSVRPGWVRTNMGGAIAPRSVQQGADTVTWLATAAPNELTGIHVAGSPLLQAGGGTQECDLRRIEYCMG